MKTFDVKKIYKNNKRLVLNTILLNKDLMSRAEISRKLNLNKSSVSRIINELIKKGVIKESFKGESTNKGGKKPIFINICKSKKLLSIFIDKYGMKYIITDIKGNKIVEEVYKSDMTKDTTLKIANFFKKIKGDGIIAGSMVIPGVLDTAKKIILYSGTLEAYNLKLNNIINQNFNFPFFIYNDSNASAIAWKYFESNRYTDYLFLLIRIDENEKILYMGSGVVLHNKILQGTNNFAGEFLNGAPEFTKNKHITFVNKNNKKIWGIDEDYLNSIVNKIVEHVFFLNPQVLIVSNNILNNDGKFLAKLNEEINRIKRIYKGFSIDIKISRLVEPELMGGIGVLLDKIVNSEIEIL